MSSYRYEATWHFTNMNASRWSDTVNFERSTRLSTEDAKEEAYWVLGDTERVQTTVTSVKVFATVETLAYEYTY